MIYKIYLQSKPKEVFIGESRHNKSTIISRIKYDLKRKNTDFLDWIRSNGEDFILDEIPFKLKQEAISFYCKKDFIVKNIERKSPLKNYSDKQIIKTHNSIPWTKFLNSKEGVWCKRNNKPLFDSLKILKKNYSSEQIKNFMQKLKNWDSFSRSNIGKFCKNNKKELYLSLMKQHSTTYSNIQLKNKIKELNYSWNRFTRSKEGSFCKQFKTELFQELKTEYKGKKIVLREAMFQEVFEKDLISTLGNLDFKLEREYVIKNNRIDLVLEINGLIINIELKHDDSRWTKKQIKNQLLKYNKDSMSENLLDTYIVSPQGKYGFSSKEFLGMIESSLKTNEYHLYQGLDYVRENNLFV